MVGRPGDLQTSWNAGELTPDAAENINLKQYYAGALQMLNVEPIPQGGFRLLPRTRFLNDLGAAPAALKMFGFSVDGSSTYDVVLTAGTIRIFKDATLVGTVACPYTVDEVEHVRATQRVETMFLWHKDHAPQRLLRNGSDTSWSLSAAAWLSMPDVDYGATYTNTDEEWIVRLAYVSTYTLAPGVSFYLSVDGEQTTMVSIADNGSGASDWTATMALVKSAIEGLAAIDTGITCTMGAVVGRTAEFTVKFSGGRNSGNNFSLSGAFVDEPSYRVLTSARMVKGKIGGEPLMSSSRGWSTCGGFFQDRLLQGGFRSKRAASIASRTAEYFDLNTELDNDAGAILINLDVDEDPLLHHIVGAQYLMMFTEKSEHFVTDRALKRNTPPNAVTASTHGSTARIVPMAQEGGIIWVNAAETIVMISKYDAVSTSVQSDPLSLLSSHLIHDTRDATLQASYRATDAQRWIMCRDDGGAVIACLIRGQDISPFIRWETDGKVRAVSVDGANRVDMLIERQVGGVARLFRERLEDGLLLDAALSVSRAASTSVTGLGIHEGATVWAIADGFVEGPFVVSGGAITLPDAAAEVTVGRWTPPVMETMPPPREIDGRAKVLHRPGRIHTVELSVVDTTSLAVGANGGPARDVRFARAGDPTDVPTPGFTGRRSVTGIVGFVDDPTCVVTQVKPGRLHVRGLVVQGKF